MININGARGGTLTAPRPTARDQAATMLASLVDDPVVGVEARIRLGYLQWAIRDDVSALRLSRAAADAKDPDDRYLAEFLLGWMAMQDGDAAAAIPHLDAALAARPDHSPRRSRCPRSRFSRATRPARTTSRSHHSTSARPTWTRGA